MILYMKLESCHGIMESRERWGELKLLTEQRERNVCRPRGKWAPWGELDRAKSVPLLSKCSQGSELQGINAGNGQTTATLSTL